MYTDSNIHFYLLFIGIVCVKSFIASAGLSPAPKTARNFTFGKSSCWELAIPLRPAAKRKHPRIFLCARLCSAPHICSVCVCVCVCVWACHWLLTGTACLPLHIQRRLWISELLDCVVIIHKPSLARSPSALCTPLLVRTQLQRRSIASPIWHYSFLRVQQLACRTAK